MATSNPPPHPDMLPALQKSWSAWVHPRPEVKLYRGDSKSSAESSTALLLPTAESQLSLSPPSSPSSILRPPQIPFNEGPAFTSMISPLDSASPATSVRLEPLRLHSGVVPATIPTPSRKKLRKPPPADFALIGSAFSFPEKPNKNASSGPSSPLSSHRSSCAMGSRLPASPPRKLTKRPPSTSFYGRISNDPILKEVPPNGQTVEKKSPIFSTPPEPKPKKESIPPHLRTRSAPPPRRTLSAALSFTALRAVRNKSHRSVPAGPDQTPAEQDEEWLPPMRAVSPFGDTIELVSSTWSPLVMTDSSGSSSGHSSQFPPSPSTSVTSASLSDNSHPSRTKSGRWTIGDPDDNDDAELDHAHTRPHFQRRDAAVGVRRRWTLAAAMADEDISDEVIVAHLERMRETAAFSEAGHASESSKQNIRTDAEVYGGPSVWLRDQCSLDPEPLVTSPSSSAAWMVARRALLICRELVRTERHYLTSMRLLLSGNATHTPPPPLMLQYARALVEASSALVIALEDDPSAWGVATAFCRNSHALEAAFVAWCGVVGGWFTGSEPDMEESTSSRRGRKGSTRSGASTPKRVNPGAWDAASSTVRDAAAALSNENPSPRGSSLRRNVSAWRKSMPSVAGLASAPPVPPLPYSPPEEKSSEGVCAERPRIRGLPGVRDLAIMPTQRIMRYVLLYRDLLAHTPTSSPSHAVVERAVDAAVLVTQKCDRAQGNAAFLMKR